MAVQRNDNSIESSNTPDYRGGRRAYYGVYRGQVKRVVYTDDQANITAGAKNPQVTYDAIIVGGELDGRIINNIRDATKHLGGATNFAERILRASESTYNQNRPDSKPPKDQIGDMIFIAFIEGDFKFPIILGFETNPLDDGNTGATSAEGPIDVKEYNGVNEEIDSDGNYSLTRKGGTLDAAKNVFVPAEGDTAHVFLKKNEIEIKEGGGAEIHLKSGTIAIGTSEVELLQKISDQLAKLIDWVNNTGATHVHIGNLGAPTPPPTNAAAWTQLGSDLTDIQSDIDQLKGSV